MIYVVEYPKPEPPKPAPPPPDVFDVYPRPWQMGEQKSSYADICDATGRRVASNVFGLSVARRIIDAVNAYIPPKD